MGFGYLSPFLVSTENFSHSSVLNMILGLSQIVFTISFFIPSLKLLLKPIATWWTFYEELKDNPRYVKCMLCFAKISRGSDFKQYHTKAGMNKHLLSKHLEFWKKLFPAKKVPEK